MGALIGTSGWQYADWRGDFYPPGVPQRRWLEYYAGHFVTVENNGTFYRLASRDTFAGWHDRVPDGFVMTVKASRYLTHVRRLRDPADPVRRMLAAASGLGDRLGPVLLQLPPTMQADPVLLEECLAKFPAAVRVAVEPRHASWWTDQTRQVLTTRNAALCWADRKATALTPLWRTADWGYLRLHEGDGAGSAWASGRGAGSAWASGCGVKSAWAASRGASWPRYARRTLDAWADRLVATWTETEDVYVYFNNDQRCAAPHDAGILAEAFRQRGRAVPLPACPPDA